MRNHNNGRAVEHQLAESKQEKRRLETQVDELEGIKQALPPSGPAKLEKPVALACGMLPEGRSARICDAVESRREAGATSWLSSGTRSKKPSTCSA